MRTRRRAHEAPATPATPDAPAATAPGSAIGTIAPDDPILAYFQSAPGPVEIDKLKLDSPALEALLNGRDAHEPRR